MQTLGDLFAFLRLYVRCQQVLHHSFKTGAPGMTDDDEMVAGTIVFNMGRSRNLIGRSHSPAKSSLSSFLRLEQGCCPSFGIPRLSRRP